MVKSGHFNIQDRITNIVKTVQLISKCLPESWTIIRRQISENVGVDRLESFRLEKRSEIDRAELHARSLQLKVNLTSFTAPTINSKNDIKRTNIDGSFISNCNYNFFALIQVKKILFGVFWLFVNYSGSRLMWSLWCRAKVITLTEW